MSREEDSARLSAAVDEIRPKAVMIENVRGFLDAVFDDYRLHLKDQLRKLGYKANCVLLNASEFGIPQLRPRVVIVALRKEMTGGFDWPQVAAQNPASATIGSVTGAASA